MNAFMMLQIYCVFSLVTVLVVSGAKYRNLHTIGQPQNYAQKNDIKSGWQEPGLWRPTWIIDSEIFADPLNHSNSSLTLGNWIFSRNRNKITRNRMFVKLNPDRSVDIRFKKRKLIDWNGRSRTLESDGNGGVEKHEIGKGGSWSFEYNESEPKLPFTLIIELHNQLDLVRYESRFTWDVYDTPSSSDPYAVTFRRGRVLSPKRMIRGVAVGGYRQIGNFVMRANAHRPVLSREYLGHQ